MTITTVRPGALSVAAWALRWGMTTQAAKVLLTTMRANVVEVDEDGRWRVTPSFAAEFNLSLGHLPPLRRNGTP